MLLAACASNAPGTSGGSECWSRLPSPLSPHRYHNVVEVDGRAYVVDGFRGASFEVYDPRTTAWRELAPMPTPRAFAAAVSIGRRIYVLGGINTSQEPLAIVEEFDVTSGTWHRRPDLRTPRSRFAAVAAGGRILALGGHSSSGNLNGTEIYHPLSGRWELGPQLLLARHGHAAVVADGVVYVLGGYASFDGVTAGPVAAVEALKLTNSFWERRADLPTARGFFGAVAVGKEIYAIGGRLLSGSPIERYSVASNKWDVLGEMPAPRQRFGAALVGSRIIVVGGEDNPREAMSYRPGCSNPARKPSR